MQLTPTAKKNNIIYLIDILKKHSDEEHPLLINDIIEIMQKEYLMEIDRKTVSRNLENLIDMNDSNYSIERTGRGVYIQPVFENSELRLIIDSILSSKNIPHSQCNMLINKLKGLSNKYFDAKIKHIFPLTSDTPENKELFFTIDVLNDAIAKSRQVQFRYNSFDVDKKLHPRKNKDGEISEYIINPYQIVTTNGRYYLICNYDHYDTVANYRIDRITNIKLLDTPSRPKSQVKGLEHGLDLPKHMAEHIYMFSGDSIRVTFRAKRTSLNEIIDWFGTNVDFRDIDDEYITAAVNVNEQAMLYWSMQYGQFVQILEPQSLIDKIKNILNDMQKKYSSL